MEVLNGGQTVAVTDNSYYAENKVACEGAWYASASYFVWLGTAVGGSLLPGAGAVIGWAVTSALVVAVTASKNDPPCK